MKDGRWVEVAPSQFDHEKQGLDVVKQLLPDAPPFRAWSNFEFRDNRGRWHEVDLLVLSRDTLYLIELKYYSGILRGNDHAWNRAGRRSEDSPLLLARRKAQYFSSLLKDRLREKAGGPIPRGVIPYVQELVFLHHENLRCELPASSIINLYGLDDRQHVTGLPGISQRLLAPPQHSPVSEEHSLLLAELMKAIGLAPRRQREVGSWIIDDVPLADGDGWQDWPAFHQVDGTRHARIRFYLPQPDETSTEDHARRRAVTQEYHLLSRLRHDGLQVPDDLVSDPELGVGLVFPQPKDDQPLDLWIADNQTTLSLEAQLDLISNIAGIVQYAHRNRVVHRALNPRAIAIRQRGSSLRAQVTDWDGAGILPATGDTSASIVSAGTFSALSTGPSDQARLFAPPEGHRAGDPAQLDVFGLGALAFYIMSGGASPATERGPFLDRLRRDGGLDLAAELPQVPSALRQLVLDATNPAPSGRIANVAGFLDQLENARQQILGTEEDADPLEAGVGAQLAGGRFTYKQRLGAGSTAVGILVVDHKAADAQRVLKVAKNSDAAGRLAAEAHVLATLENENSVVTLYEKLEVGNRTALLLRYAGRTTLAEELTARDGRLSIDVLERWGTDLIAASVALERSGLTHRDIKPSNLGVYQTSDRADTHLMMFDFSMAGVDARNVDAGTPPYLDPFLGVGDRTQYDTAAERYGVAAVLFEMATGTTPIYGPDPHANPRTINDDVTIARNMFDAPVAAGLESFFRSSLSREVANRPDTAEDMLRLWKAVFSAVGTNTSGEDNDAHAERAELHTPLASSGLTARAVSALSAAEVATVGELLALDSTRLNRLVSREAKDTRKEIRARYQQWTRRFGKRQRRGGDADLVSLDNAVQLLLAAVGGRSATRKEAAELLLGITPGLDEFASGHELASALGKSAPRGGQLLNELQEAWAANPETRALVDNVLEVAKQVLTDSGGVAAIATLTAEIRARFPESDAAPSDVTARKSAERAAGGLLRVALDRQREHETAMGERELLRRRHDGRLALIATDERLLAGAEAAARRADELVVKDPNVLVPTSTAANELGDAFRRGYQTLSDEVGTIPAPADLRLIRLAAALSRTAVVSGRTELHNIGMSPAFAIKVALTGLSQTESLSPSQVRSRVAARFPYLDRVPSRPTLDNLMGRAELGISWDGEAYRFPDAKPPSTTSLHSRGASTVPTAKPDTAAAEVLRDREALLGRSRDEAGFVVIGVPVPPTHPGLHLRAAERLAERYDGTVVDITGQMIGAMRRFGERRGISWDLIRSADAAEQSTPNGRGLRAVLDQVMPELAQQLQETVFEGSRSDNPLILTEVSPLARYGHLDVLAKLSDLSAPRCRPIWVIVPQVRGQRGAMVDGKPIQLGSLSGQFMVWAGAADVAPVADREVL